MAADSESLSIALSSSEKRKKNITVKCDLQILVQYDESVTHYSTETLILRVTKYFQMRVTNTSRCLRLTGVCCSFHAD